MLLDWGATTPFPLKGSRARAERRFRSLVKSFAPDVMVVRNARLNTHENSLLEFVQSEAALQSIPFLILSSIELQQAFSIFVVQNKYDIADVLTRIFPELASRLPRRRRRWEKEPLAMTIFGAVAIGFAYWQRNRNELPIEK